MTKKSMPKIVVIGGGATGCGVARDLVLRGYQTTLIESGNLGSGTSSRSHGMLQSGARYAVTETSFAAECYQERNIISKIFPKAVKLIGGLFISLPNDPEDYPENSGEDYREEMRGPSMNVNQLGGLFNMPQSTRIVSAPEETLSISSELSEIEVPRENAIREVSFVSEGGTRSRMKSALKVSKENTISL